MVPVDEPFDIVVTTNSGYPLDLNLYQTVKGICAADGIVRPGGTILVASECSDGLPDHGRYGALLASHHGPAEYLRALESGEVRTHDQWQVQKQALVLERARVMVHASGLDGDALRAAWFEPVEDLGTALERLIDEYGPACRVAGAPRGAPDDRLSRLTRGLRTRRLRGVRGGCQPLGAGRGRHGGGPGRSRAPARGMRSRGHPPDVPAAPEQS